MKRENDASAAEEPLSRRGFVGSSLAAAVAVAAGSAMATVVPAAADTAKADSAGKTTDPSAKLQVGAAVKDITPTSDMFPLTRAPNVTLNGVLDPLHTRVLALSSGAATVLVVSTETGRGPYGPQFAEAVAKQTGIPIEAVFLTATHSHAAPEVTVEQNYTFDDSDPDVTNLQRWGKLVMDRMLEAAAEAVRNMRPATVGIGYSESYVNVNRSAVYNKVADDGTVTEYRNLGFNPTGPTDRKVATLRFDGLDGEPIAFLVNYAVHGTVMHANTIGENGATKISSDIPGQISTCLEDKYAGSVALWLSAAAGDQNPIVQNDIYTRDPKTGEFSEKFSDNYDILSYVSRINFADVETALASISRTSGDVTVNFDYAETTIPGTTSSDFMVSLQLLRIGDIALVGYSGELFSRLGHDLKDGSLLKHTLVLNHCWQKTTQYTGYVADDKSKAEGGFGTTAPFRTGYLSKALVKLQNALIKETDKWTLGGDGTATNSAGRTVLIGLSGRPDGSDADRIVNSAGKVLLKHVKVAKDASGKRHVNLGNGFLLYPGTDAKLGSGNAVVRSFGSYPQTDPTGTTKQPLDWRLLDISGNTAVLATAEIVDGAEFNPDDNSNAWNTSNLRAWLNSTGGKNLAGDPTGFYDAAFTAAEKRKILKTAVSMKSSGSYPAYNKLLSSDWWGTWTTTGTSTTDYVWALSGEEAFRYFGPSKIATEAELGFDPANYTNGYFVPTAYAHNAGVKINEGDNGPSFVGFGDVWTRSPGAPADGTDYYGVFLGSTGSLNVGRPVTRPYGTLPIITVGLALSRVGLSGS
ncbi:neutral/alkaline non-lysosomal ceramidase N-terminal domain-containing protein [Streptomyces sp. NPDC023723]|uniref:neutral/alkaline non-lysosomal ceramidase N-terminal domain-containing protein n=1 Tax=Streptomyces sp. NPDC023723 TaxID=3154323 RepID=UPI0033EB6C88